MSCVAERLGMMYLGPLVMESLLFPNLSAYFERLEPALASTNPNLVERLEAQNCFGIAVVREKVITGALSSVRLTVALI